MKKEHFDQSLPASVRTNILQYHRDPLKPRQHVQLSKKQLKGKQQYIIPMMKRLQQEGARKDILTQTIRRESVDLAVYKIAKKKYNDFVRRQAEEGPNMMLPLKRSPNYFKYVSQDFLESLGDHPYTKKIHALVYHDDALIYFRLGSQIIVVHLGIPENRHFTTPEEIKRYIIEYDPPITDFAVLFRL